MGREWKPGDVAMVRQLDGKERLAIVGTYGRPAALRPPHFVYFDGGYDDVRGWAGSARPLVVIDPDDRKQVERLVRAYLDCGDGIAELSTEPWSLPGMRLRQALREFANPTPPKPPEPTGLGAVVEDADGSLMIRTNSKRDLPWTCAGTGSVWSWSSIDAVKVRSDGVTS